MLSLREDFLAELTEFESHIPAVFYNHFRLKKLRVEQARRSILGPAGKFDFRYEDRVVEELLEVLSEGGIDPPQLQIICDKLYDTLTEDDRTIDWNKYQRVGGGKGILSKYLQDVVDSFSLQQQDTVREVLKELVTYTGTKGILFLDALSRKLEIEKGVIADVLKRLIRARLVRPYDDGVKQGFELTHEYLTEEINEWISDEEIQLKAAESLLRQEFDSWKRFGTMMEADKLRIIDDQREHLALEENCEEKAFILLASIHHDYEFEYWLEQNKHSPVASQRLCDLLSQAQVHVSSLRRAALAVGLLGTRSDLFRERALGTLKKVGNPHLFPVLEAHLQSEDRVIASFASDAIDAIKSRFLSDMIYIEAGDFIMGSNEEEVESLIQEYGIERARLQGEIPRRHAYSEGFWIDKYPVTNAQYREFDLSYEYPEGKEDHPAVNLNYNHALAYAQWLGKELPTEEEWEKAARGTDGRIYPWGNEWDAAKCNTHEGGVNESTPVNAYPNGASPYGCIDMAGNVWEWVDSWFDEQSGLRVAKGGGWAAARLWARCAARHRTHFTSQFHLVGFRCVIRD